MSRSTKFNYYFQSIESTEAKYRASDKASIKSKRKRKKRKRRRVGGVNEKEKYHKLNSEKKMGYIVIDDEK